ncbi:hypothetical protein [Mycobacterium sp. SMC-4]|uniref:hypothetical protein n=1 Tax=Mycobacterium sp. SMC-4 TaxID=2857059 RepID=UPI003D00720E
MDAEMDWDDEVDVVCTGAGIAGLSIAVFAVDEGAEVLVAEPPVTVSDRRWWPLDCADEHTRAYLAELTADFDASQLGFDEDDLPVRSILTDRGRGSRTVPPFVGSRMRDWAAQCICSPSGFLYTRVTDWPTATLALSGGEEWEVAEIGTVTSDGGDRVEALHKWLTVEADERDVERFAVAGLQRLVFDAGMVAGAVFDTEDGPYSVRSRHGVLICPQAQTSRREAGHAPATGELRAALVGRAGSRFGRVELLEPPTADETY